MRHVFRLCGLLALVALPAVADAPFAPPTPIIDAGAVKPGARTVAQTFAINGINGTLEKTTFAEVEKHFGGMLERQGDAAEAITWLCYDLPDRHLRVWLSSDELHNQLGLISEVTIWSAPSPANSPRCPVAPGAQSAEVGGIKPGQAWTSVQARLGAPSQAKGGWAAYAHSAPAGGGFTESDYLVVKIDGGRVTHLQASRGTVN